MYENSSSGSNAVGPLPVEMEEFAGDHFEMGMQQGLKYGAMIHEAFSTLRSNKEIASMKPSIVPMGLFMRYASGRALKEMRSDVATHYPEQARRMEGISRGAGIDLSLMYLCLGMETVLATVDYRLGACTAMGVAADRNSMNEPIVIKNFDYPPFFSDYYVTRFNKPSEGIRCVDVSVAPMAGSHDGVNEEGLAVSYNYGYGTDIPKANTPVTLLIQQVLEKCANVEEAINMISSSPRNGGAIILLADSGGSMATVEISPNFEAVRYSEDGIIINTNHYITPGLSPYDIPRNAYYTNKSPRPLRGLRVHESSELRYQRIQELTKEIEVFSVKDLVQIFSDHGESQKGDDNTICRHGEYFQTNCSLIIFPKSGRLLISYDYPCRSIFTEFRDIFAEDSGEDLTEDTT